MVQPDAYQELLNSLTGSRLTGTSLIDSLIGSLRTATGLLELQPDTPLQRDVTAVCNQFTRSNFRIAVFGPFNYGKSTLLNALLGERALPIDLIPTTGGAITVRYGETLYTWIRLTDGSEIGEAGTEILKQYAILDDQRRMRGDVAAIEVLCPHPFLKTGVELVDLPGTDDREAQDALVKDQLLMADLIVQVLDGRKLMTLGEREHLRDWLQDRGIETVIFVVNFLNLLEPDDQKQVYNRLRFVAESFRSKLPPGISNLYRVDALPALRARLKGDMAAAQMAGLPTFESALQAIVQAQHEQTELRLPRVVAIARQVQTALQTKTNQLQAEINAITSKRDQKIQIKQKATQLINQGFTTSVREFMDWLSVTNLLDRYQTDIAQALVDGSFKTWETGEFKRMAIDHQQAVAKWVQQACEFFERSRPNQLLVTFPPEPVVSLPDPPPSSHASKKSDDVTPVALATGLGWVLGGPVGGAILGGASYLLNKTLDSADPTPSTATPAMQMTYAHLEAAKDYLVNFSTINLAALQKYQTAATQVLQYDPATEPSSVPPEHQYQLQLLESTLDQLTECVRSLQNHD